MPWDPGLDCSTAGTGKISCPDSKHRFANVLQSLLFRGGDAA